MADNAAERQERSGLGSCHSGAALTWNADSQIVDGQGREKASLDEIDDGEFRMEFAVILKCDLRDEYDSGKAAFDGHAFHAELAISAAQQRIRFVFAD